MPRKGIPRLERERAEKEQRLAEAESLCHRRNSTNLLQVPDRAAVSSLQRKHVRKESLKDSFTETVRHLTRIIWNRIEEVKTKKNSQNLT